MARIKLVKTIFFALAVMLLFSMNTWAQDFETVAVFDQSVPPGNIAVGPDERIFLSVHGFFGQPVKVVELLKDGTTKPYPNNEWAYAPKKGSNGLYGVLGLNVDENGVLWMLDTSGEDRSGRLVGWDTKKEKLHKIIYLAEPIIRSDSFLNDLAIDTTNNFIYIADTASQGAAAIIVVNLATGHTRRVLEGAKVTQAEDLDMVIDDRVIRLGDAPARIGVNPITIDPQHQWVYFGAMSGKSIYRIQTGDLSNTDLGDEVLEQKVERYGDKPLSDGITMDGDGNVYITSITDDSIGVVTKEGIYKTLFRRDDLSWPDGLAFGPDQKIYATINELHRSPVLNGGQNEAKGEFKVIRFDSLAKGKSGR